MTNDNKRLLVSLLREYQNDLLKADKRNQIKSNDHKWNEIIHGVKAQYNHARVIADRLDVEIGNEMKGWY